MTTKQDLLARMDSDAARPAGADDSAFATLGVLWEKRVWIGAVTLVAAIGAGTVGLLTPRKYGATTTLLALAGKDTEDAQSIATTLQPVVVNQGMVAGIVQEFKLGAAPHKLSPEGFFREASGRTHCFPTRWE